MKNEKRFLRKSGDLWETKLRFKYSPFSILVKHSPFSIFNSEQVFTFEKN